MDELNAPNTFEQVLGNTTPTLLDFLDALEDVDMTADALPMASTVPAKGDNRPRANTKSNTWRQRQRLDVLRLRDEVKHLDAELKKIKLASGVRSTLPLVEGVSTIAAAELKIPVVKRLLGQTWQDAASRESLARQMANIDNEQLRRVLHMQVKYARKLHRMITQQMTNAAVAQVLGCLPAFSEDDVRPPQDNNVVFQKILSAMDGYCKDVGSIFVTENASEEKDEGHVSIHHARGLQVQLVNTYAVPFSVGATEQAIWKVLTGRERNDENSRVAYNELFEFDRTTTLQSIRTFIGTGPYELCFLIRKGCRKYVKGDRTYFVVHEASIVSSAFGAGVSYEEVVRRTVQHEKDKRGAPTTIIKTHVLATFPSYKTRSCISPEGLKAFHDSLMRFNHKVEDALISKVNVTI
ncbi:hypothetical protein PInf_018106 [Phytophthora infestans]|nr:hypothetical protein PInf_018106 [Phytophthora infestans]